MLQNYLQQRLRSLQTEFETGQTMLAELEAKQANLRETLLRISGAIQVLQECLNEAVEADGVEDTAEYMTNGTDEQNGHQLEPANLRD